MTPGWAETVGTLTEAITDLEIRMLFVGMTRASMDLSLVMSDRAENLLMKRLG